MYFSCTAATVDFELRESSELKEYDQKIGKRRIGNRTDASMIIRTLVKTTALAISRVTYSIV